MGQSPGKPCSFGDGLYTLWLHTDLLVMFCQSGTNSHIHKQSTRPLPHSILNIHTDYLGNPAPEEDNSDNTQHHCCPGSVPAQVSQHNPSPSLFWQWKQVPRCCQWCGNEMMIDWMTIDEWPCKMMNPAWWMIEWLNDKWLNDEEDDSDDAQCHHRPGSVPAQVSQHDPPPPPLTVKAGATSLSVMWQWDNDQLNDDWWTTPHNEQLNNQMMKRMTVTTHNIITVQGLCQPR